MADYISLNDSLMPVAHRLSEGPARVAIDTERAQGFAYGDDAYLVQIRREDGPIFLVDSMSNRDMSIISSALADCTWIVHSADQDLVCLKRLNMRPTRLFDTEVAAELTGCPHISLAGLLDDFLNIHISKRFQKSNWSRRPLPQPWLDYAAHDVEYLHELMDRLSVRAQQMGRSNWVEEECAFVKDNPSSGQPKPDPWRRMKGMTKVNDVLGQAIVYSLWLERELIAERKNIAPHRILPNDILVWAGKNHVLSIRAMQKLKHNGVRWNARAWSRAFDRARNMTREDLPSSRSHAEDAAPYPPAYLWKRDEPQRYEWLTALSQCEHDIEESYHVPMYRVLSSPNRHLVAWLWEKPGDVRRILCDHSPARQWQIDLIEPYFEAIFAGEDVPDYPDIELPDIR